MTYKEQQAIVIELDAIEAELERLNLAEFHARIQKVRMRLHSLWAVAIPVRGGRSLWEESED